MTSIFRTAGAWGAGKGAPLTWAEQDNNTYDKETRLTAIEAAGVAVGISSITVSGDQMTIHMSDSSLQGPFTLPSVAWLPQGIWQPSSLYHVNDVIYAEGGAYLVNVDHTSATSFDPNELAGTIQIYSLILPYAPAPGFEISATTFTPALEHSNSYVRLTSASGCAVTIDPGIAFLDWTEIHFRDASTDTGASCTFAISAPGSINDVTGYLNQSRGGGSTVTLKKVADTDVWDILGLLEPVA